ncbi:tetratricopeptide repeat protein [Aliagarivorans marinus]|uniref:tetratricopeptide repeat protein n=1 Tax=Aliagarivorans marinus TaxID=561965 RepID=UPI00040240F9|nr:tetratricopeptide repeat protein [Aliagarivorans marinus]
MNRRFSSLSIGIAALVLSLSANAASIQVLSAVKKDTPISGAQVTWQRSGESSLRSQTNSRGQVEMGGFADDGDTTMLIEKDGYSTLVVKCPCDGFTYALSPEMPNLDGMRIVLTWGAKPSDLDSHLTYSGNHIAWYAKEGNNAHLDVDDTDSYGPETITITQRKQGDRYVYMVRDYSNRDQLNSSALSRSNARVEVYVGRTLIRSYQVAEGIEANNWVVFGIDESGAFHDINQYLSLPSEESSRDHMRELLAADSFESHAVITDAMKQRARQLNTRGEAVYAEGNYEQAMYLFQEALNLNPEFSQAYGNLGVTYPKLGRDAEALWANRKAIELASGSRANTIKAGSFFNIARIYEKAGNWPEALTHFEAALALREHSAYHNGIARMKEKLAN